MDLKDFKDGLTSLSFVIFIFSLTFMIGSIVLKPYIALEPIDRDFIVILCIINIIFSFYYLREALIIDKVFKLEEKYILHYAKRILIITIIYSIHFGFFISLLFRDLHNLEVMMIYLIIIMQFCLISVIFKESYDLLFKDESERKYELDYNRTRYLEPSERREHLDKKR